MSAPGSGSVTLNFLSYESRSTNRAAPLYFAVFLGAQLACLYAIIWFFFPWTWEQQLSAGAGAIVLTGLATGVVLCFGEYFFHRYLLHIETVRFLRTLCTSHLAHHKLTSIGFDSTRSTVRSAYPITDVEQDDQATFPPWALIPFWASFTPFFASIAFSFPTFPILIGGYAAITIAHFLYETIHVLHHLPYDPWWKRQIASPILGPMWRRMYGFHQGHHANYKCNQNVAGFYGIPLGDLVFGTYRQPDLLLVDGAPATKEAARKLTPEPRWPVSWLDRVVFKRRRWMSKRN